MLGPALVASALASAVVAWGLPAIVPPPLIFEPNAEVEIGLVFAGEPNKEIIRGIIRRHIDDVKACYEQGLSDHPDLAGRINVQFTIAASGQVIASDPAFHHGKRADRDLHRRGCPPLAVPEGRRRRGRDHPISVHSDADRRRPKLVAGTNGAGAVEIEAFDSTLFVHRSTDANGGCLRTGWSPCYRARAVARRHRLDGKPRPRPCSPGATAGFTGPGFARRSPTSTTTATAAWPRSSAGTFRYRRST